MKTETCTFRLTGMICPACEDEVNTALLHTRGVRTTDASYRKASVVIQYDPEIISEEHLTDILKETGYPVGGNGKSGIWSDVISAGIVAVLYYLIPMLTGLVTMPTAEAGVSCTALFLVGLLTGVHCIGMCGGIMLTVCPAGAQKNVWFYNTGRVLSYTITGAVFGLIGRALVYDVQMKSMLQTMCGVLVVLVGLKQWGIPLLNRFSLQMKSLCETVKNSRLKTPLAVGILNGLMPCGALSGGWMVAAASGSLLQGALDMLCFGAGTLPAMLLFGSMGKFLPKKYNRYIIRGSTVIILALGLRMAVRGIGILL